MSAEDFYAIYARDGRAYLRQANRRLFGHRAYLGSSVWLAKVEHSLMLCDEDDAVLVSVQPSWPVEALLPLWLRLRQCETDARRRIVLSRASRQLGATIH